MRCPATPTPSQRAPATEEEGVETRSPLIVCVPWSTVQWNVSRGRRMAMQESPRVLGVWHSGPATEPGGDDDGGDDDGGGGGGSAPAGPGGGGGG